MDKFFKISERNSTVGREVIGGATTFLAMAYIIALNPIYLSTAGMDFTAAVTATCIGAAIMTLLMGVIANRPLALASGMGINAIVAFTLCLGLGLDWRVSMAIIFIEGVIILILVLCGLRKAIMDAIPADLRRAIGIGIGLFIAFIGLKGAGIIVANDATVIGIGNFSDPGCIVALISILLAVALIPLKVPGGLLISIVVAVIIGIPLGVTPAPEGIVSGLDFSAMAAPFLADPNTGVVAVIEVFTQPVLLLFVFSILMSDFFDTMGTVVAVGQQAEFVDEKGDVEDIQPILVVDSAAALVGGFCGASSITTYVESTSGAAAGARTGLSCVIVAALFFIFAFFSPLIAVVTSAATCGALTVVGYLMMSDIGQITWDKIEYAFPAFITIIGIPFTYSITDGIGFGFIAFVIIMLLKGRGKEVKGLMWGSAVVFAIYFVCMAMGLI